MAWRAPSQTARALDRPPENGFHAVVGSAYPSVFHDVFGLMMANLTFETLHSKMAGGTATVGVIRLGYVGLPLCMAIGRSPYRAAGFDIDPAKPGLLNAGKSYIGAVSDTELMEQVSEGRIRPLTISHNCEPAMSS